MQRPISVSAEPYNYAACDFAAEAVALERWLQDGFVVEFEERWTDAHGENCYARERWLWCNPNSAHGISKNQPSAMRAGRRGRREGSVSSRFRSRERVVGAVLGTRQELPDIRDPLRRYRRPAADVQTIRRRASPLDQECRSRPWRRERQAFSKIMMLMSRSRPNRPCTMSVATGAPH
jgi:hypothetical protein